ncbi:reverse transcriptase, partial [Teladorsagia circumcincta]
LKKKFATVFKPGLGHCTKSKAKLVLKPDAKPVFQKARPVPYAAVQKISTEIDRLVSTHVLTPIDHSEWAAPIVAVQKKNGTIRLCADYSTGLNDALEQHQHPLPTPDDIFTKLNGGRYFSQLDLAEAYLQVEVDDDSKQLLTINTHQGLYRFNRLPFGVKPAPGIFQQCIDALIAGLDGTAAYLDDILVTGRTIDEHNTRLDAVFQRIQDYGFRVRLEKCSFLQTQIKYLGFVINAQGRRPDPDKVKAIQKMPAPNDVSQLRTFLGLINFYGNFVKDLHNLRAPLDALTKKDAVYTWTPECQSSFDKIKATLNSDLLLTYYDPNLPIIPAPGGAPLMMAPNPAAAAPPQDLGLPPVAPAQMTPERQRNFVVRQGNSGLTLSRPDAVRFFTYLMACRTSEVRTEGKHTRPVAPVAVDRQMLMDIEENSVGVVNDFLHCTSGC